MTGAVEREMLVASMNEEIGRLQADRERLEYRLQLAEEQMTRMRATIAEKVTQADDLKKASAAMATDLVEAKDRALHLAARNEALAIGLGFYADPETYHAISFVTDPPCGEFAQDFDNLHGGEGYERTMPGRRARIALGWYTEETTYIEQVLRDAVMAADTYLRLPLNVEAEEQFRNAVADAVRALNNRDKDDE